MFLHCLLDYDRHQTSRIPKPACEGLNQRVKAYGCLHWLLCHPLLVTFSLESLRGVSPKNPQWPEDHLSLKTPHGTLPIPSPAAQVCRATAVRCLASATPCPCSKKFPFSLCLILPPLASFEVMLSGGVFPLCIHCPFRHWATGQSVLLSSNLHTGMWEPLDSQGYMALWASLVAQLVENLTPMRETCVWPLG